MDSSKAFLEFKELLQPGCSVEQIGLHALKLMELMQLRRIEKGSELMDLKFKSLQSRWYGCKQNRPEDGEVANVGIYISRDTLISLPVTRGNTTTLEHCRVLALFSKHYNKWFLHWDGDEVLFEKGSKKFKVLARMVKKEGSSWTDVELVKDGNWGPKFVFSIKPMCDIESVEGKLTVGGFLNY